MKGYKENTILEGRAAIAIASATTTCIGKGHIKDNQDAVRLRVRVNVSAVDLSGGTAVGTLYTAPDGNSTLLTTGKTITINATGDWYFVVNESDTSLIPLMPYLEVRIVTTGAATLTVAKCGLFRA